MVIHDWSQNSLGLFHHFRQFWTGAICDGLNDRWLPEGFYALIESHSADAALDMLTLRQRGGLAVADAPPKTRFVSRGEAGVYAVKANRVVVRTSSGRVVAAIEILSPGNKSSQYAVRSFVEKTLDLLRQDINVLVIDLFPPSARDPQGIHPLIWGEVGDEPFELPTDKPLTLAAYVAGLPWTAYVEPVAVGNSLPDMPVFLDAGTYVPVPLDSTYRETWDRCPREFKDAVLATAR
jgi:hypothetical protein